MAAKNQSESAEVISIPPQEYAHYSCWVVGVTPFVCNRQSEKVKRELLMPSPKKNAAQRAQNLKHRPLDEFRDSPYTLADESAPTLLAFLATAFKKAMMTASLDVPGSSKAQIGRMIRVDGERLPLYGVPKMMMSVTRMADQKRTPDVRTRAVVERWAIPLTITYPSRIIKIPSVVNLLAAAGNFAGVGDWRTEKGSGNFGSFRIANDNDSELTAIIKEGGRAAQMKAMSSPAFYDDETKTLYDWWNDELSRRQGDGGAKTAGSHNGQAKRVVARV